MFTLVAWVLIAVAYAAEIAPDLESPLPKAPPEVEDLDPIRLDDFALPPLEDLAAPPVEVTLPEPDPDQQAPSEEPALLPAFGMLNDLPKDLKISHEGTLNFDRQGENVIYDGHVKISGDNGLQIFADRATINQATESILLEGNVVIYRGAILHRGERARYSYSTRQLDTSELRTGVDPFVFKSEKLRSEIVNGEQVIIAENASFTTHDSDNPHYWIKTKEARIYPGDRVDFDHLKLEANGISIFWLPYLSQPLNRALGYQIRPGARSNLGVYVRNRYGFLMGGPEKEDQWTLQTHLDYYTRRGFGLGLDFLDPAHLSSDEFGWLKFYYISDRDPNIERANITRNGVDPDRFRVQLRRRFPVEWSQAKKEYWDANLTWLSDEFFLEDYFQSDFVVDPEPDNYISYQRQSERSLLQIGARVRVNDFYQTDTRLPEATFEWTKSPFLDSKVLYESQTRLGYLTEEFSDQREEDLESQLLSLPIGDPLRPALELELEEPSYLRFHSWHEWSLPLSYKGGLNLTPRAGAGWTHYSNIDNVSGSLNRHHLSLGLDTSIKFSKLYPDLKNPRFGLNGLKHVIQPYLQYSLYDTEETPVDFKPIDRFAATTRPRSLTLGRHHAIDDLEDWNIVRLGLRNNLLTRRDDDTHHWLSTNTFIDYYLTDPEFDRKFSNLYHETVWNPLPWLSLYQETQIPLIAGGSGFREFNLGTTYMPNENVEFNLEYNYLEGHPSNIDSHRVRLYGHWRINDSWGFNGSQFWELDEGTLEYQEYGIHRDLDSWIIALSAYRRDNRNKNEFGVAINFTLKEFPTLNLPISVDPE